MCEYPVGGNKEGTSDASCSVTGQCVEIIIQETAFEHKENLSMRVVEYWNRLLMDYVQRSLSLETAKTSLHMILGNLQ